MNDLTVLDWGLIDYEQALQKQLDLVEQVYLNQEIPGYLVFCSHPEVVTIGRQTQQDDLFDWTGKIVEVSRGGRATYHGPSQSVVYPIINLKKPRKNHGPQEVRGLIRDLEQALVLTLQQLGLTAHGKTSKTADTKDLSDTGVWINDLKIASIGIAVRKWISFHGMAINILNDPQAFQGINPCGYNSSIMTNLEKQLGRPIAIHEFNSLLKLHLVKLL